jgi:hypothetical protein
MFGIKKFLKKGIALDINRITFFEDSLSELNNIFNRLKPSPMVDKLNKVNIEFFSGWDKENQLYELLTKTRKKIYSAKLQPKDPTKQT